MGNERDYASLIPKEPPQGLVQFLREKERKFPRGVLAFRHIGRETAEAELYCEDCAGDFRPEWEEEKEHKTALLWCSECGREMLAEYIKEEGCGRYGGPPAGIRLEDEMLHNGARHTFQERNEMNCPYCGEPVWLKRAGEITHGWGEAVQVTALTVAQPPESGQSGGLPVLTVWNVERRIGWKRQEVRITPYFAYILDGKKLVKLVQYRRYGNGYSYDYAPLHRWEQLKKATDTLGVPYFYDELPCLDGTILENAKLPEYYAQAYEASNFHPLGYVRLYLRHPNVENLVTAGMGKLLGAAICKEAGRGWRNSLNTPKLSWVHWKEARPAQMLGLTKEQLRKARADGWGLEAFEFWNRLDWKMRFADAAEVLRLVEAMDARRMLEDGAELLKTARYLHKQGERYTILRDYRRMAREAGWDLEDETAFWPPHLHQAHDRANAAAQYKANEKDRKAFEQMSTRCAALSWERDGICIRPALEPEELIAEGNTLHHCVGGYAKSHAAGKIVLFIRHTRRPERSWFTLNVDVKEKRVIQLHGYGNEHSPKGERLRIPREVKDFVGQWKEQVLTPWKLPREDPPQGGRTPGEAPEKAEKKARKRQKQSRPAV